MGKVQAALIGAYQSVPERAGCGDAEAPVSRDATLDKACAPAGGEAGRSLLSPPLPSTQRRSLFRR